MGKRSKKIQKLPFPQSGILIMTIKEFNEWFVKHMKYDNAPYPLYDDRKHLFGMAAYISTKHPTTIHTVLYI